MIKFKAGELQVDFHFPENHCTAACVFRFILMAEDMYFRYLSIEPAELWKLQKHPKKRKETLQFHVYPFKMFLVCIRLRDLQTIYRFSVKFW